MPKSLTTAQMLPVPLAYSKEMLDLETARARHANTIARLGKHPRGSKPDKAVEREAAQARAELEAAIQAYCSLEGCVDVRLGLRK